MFASFLPRRKLTAAAAALSLSCAGAGPDQNASQFYITTGEELQSLDEKHTLFGEVAEGWEVLEAINEAPCDADGRPLQNIR